MIIKIRPKNSAWNKNKDAAALQKHKIKNNTDSTGFKEVQTKYPQ
jgi:hypothetical protein